MAKRQKRHPDDDNDDGGPSGNQRNNNPDDGEDGDGDDSGDEFAIHKLETRKDDIKQPDAAIADVIPRLTSNCLFVGCSGSGKSTLLVNLIKGKKFWHGWFDRVILVSPTGKTDDIQREIHEYIENEDTDLITDLREAPGRIREIMDEQREIIETKGADKAPQVLLVYDDVVSDKDLLTSDEFGKSFIMSRHFNFTTCLCTQSFTQAPRKCRLQCQNLFYYKGSNSEMELLVEEFSPPGFSKVRMRLLISFCTRDKYSFMHVNRRSPFSLRYRKNLDQVVDLDSVPML